MIGICDLKNKKTHMVKVLLIFYVLAASNYTHNMFSKQLKEFLKDNKMAQHVISLLAMIVLTSTVGGFTDNKKILIYAVFGYLWFVFSTKLDIHWNIVILAILVVGYFYENSLDNYELELQNDKNVSEYKKIIIEKQDDINKLLILVAAIGVTAVGTFMYSNKKQIQHGGSYDPLIYFLY
jgi:hypothetical protein